MTGEPVEVTVHCRIVRGDKLFGVSAVENNVTGWEAVADLARLSDLAIAQTDKDPEDCDVGESFTVTVSDS